MLHLISDDNNSASQITRLYDLSVLVPDEALPALRAILSATDFQPGPISGTFLSKTPVNGSPPPFPGQPIPGFSAVIPNTRAPRTPTARSPCPTTASAPRTTRPASNT